MQTTCPRSFSGDQYWGPSNVLFALWQYAEGERATHPDASAGMAAFKNATQAMLRHLVEQQKSGAHDVLGQGALD